MRVLTIKIFLKGTNPFTAGCLGKERVYLVLCVEKDRKTGITLKRVAVNIKVKMPPSEKLYK